MSALMIKDLPLSQDLDRKAMRAVRGGTNVSVIGQNGIGNVASVTQVDLSSVLTVNNNGYFPKGPLWPL
ncbi:hypothetical protein [Noviherbaspirillum massiliense]|uniref:hypothetical protein n=1 Tax=Noviherbaspirillum massiliense TaxID=1465823 RepID=UPI0002D4FC75|nr:hypothetical protein [Noviherbaspirillum massiliense]